MTTLVIQLTSHFCHRSWHKVSNHYFLPNLYLPFFIWCPCLLLSCCVLLLLLSFLCSFVSSSLQFFLFSFSISLIEIFISPSRAPRLRRETKVTTSLFSVFPKIWSRFKTWVFFWVLLCGWWIQFFSKHLFCTTLDLLWTLMGRWSSAVRGTPTHRRCKICT